MLGAAGGGGRAEMETAPPSAVLAWWNTLDAEAAAESVLPCCGSKAWAKGMAAERPIGNAEALLAASGRIWFALPSADWHEAFESHPRIGERRPQGDATAAALAWSGAEQSSVTAAEDAEKRKLRDGNARYEQRFGRIFLICASGRSPREIAAEMERRLSNTPSQELQEAAQQQAEITLLRLRRWLQTELERKDT